jgi:DNA-binding transcriptional regulator YiaG
MAAISAKRNSKGTDQLDLANLVRETRQRLELSQAKFATKLGVSFQSVNRWENGRTKPLPIALKQIEHLLHQMGESGKELLVKYFSE